MGTDVFYNGCVLRNVLTEELSQTPVRDSSNTDKVWDKFVGVFECIISLAPYDRALHSGHGVIGLEIPGGPTCYNPQEILVAARGLLNADRGAFRLVMEGTTVLEADATTAADSGPKVLKAEIKQFAPALLRVRFSIEIVKACDGEGSGNPQWPVINNRWSVADDVDESFRTRRTWAGRLVLATLDSAILRTPHLFRNLCVPPLNPGWKRVSMRFMGSESGLELGYEVVDEELANEGPPWPAVSMEITHEKAFNPVSTPRQVETLSVSLRGPCKVDRRQLVWRLAQIIIARGRLNPETAVANRLLRSLRISESSNEKGCIVTGDARFTSIGGTENQSGKFSAIDIYPLGETLTLPALGAPNDPDLYDPNRPYATGPFGSGMGLLVSTLSAAWQTPCTGNHANIQGVLVPPAPMNGPQGSTEPPTITWTNGQPPDKQGPNVNEPSQQAIYEHCEIQSKLDFNYGAVQLPYAAPVTSGDPPRTKTCAVISLHAPAVRRIVTMRLERIGEWPTIYRARKFTDSQGIEHTPSRFVVESRPSEVLADGNVLHSIDLNYEFLLDEEPDDSKPIPVGVLLWDTRTAADNAIPPNAWKNPDTGSQGLN